MALNLKTGTEVENCSCSKSSEAWIAIARKMAPKYPKGSPAFGEQWLGMGEDK